jgi:multidrug transporter EmrE-like cation transporter
MSVNPLFFMLVLLIVGLNTVGQLLLKYGADFNDRGIINLYLIGGISAYGLSTISYVLLLSRLNLSVVYPALIGLSTVSITIASAAILREKIDVVNWIGVGLIIAGIFAVTLKKSA